VSSAERLPVAQKAGVRFPPSSDVCRPVPESLKQRAKMEGTTSAVERVALGPTGPPVGLVPVVVGDPFERAPVAIGVSKVDLQRPARVIDGLDARAKPVLPIAIALRFIPAREPV